MVRRMVCVAVAICLCVIPALAQGGRAEVNGTVFDQKTAVLPGVAVTATDEATGLVRTTTSNESGRFVISSVVPGRYTMKAELAGFQTQTRTGVVVSVGQEITVDFTLPVGAVAEQVTVTEEVPIVEITSTRVGANISNSEIDSLPSLGRNQLSLMQLVPGLTPSLAPGTFEGGQYNANGRDTGSNLFLVDGVYDNDDRLGGSQGTQARVTLDTMAEYQVLTHQYGAEYGGSSGVVVNAVTKSGTNAVHGRGFFYLQDESLDATDYFLKKAGEKNSPSGNKVGGFNVGGPFVKNKAFWFFNLERNVVNEAANLIFPAEAAPLARSYSGSTDTKAWNTFVRGDYQLTPGNSLSFRWLREAAITIGENLETNLSTLDNALVENDAGDQIFNLNWTSVVGNRSVNEFKATHVRENLLQGPRSFFDENFKFIELAGRDQFDVGSQNSHPDFTAGPRAQHGSSRIRTYDFSDNLTYTSGSHTLKAGIGHSRNEAPPVISGGNDVGTFTFGGNRPFDPAVAGTYPIRFQIRLGQIYYNIQDRRTNFFVQDKWQLNRRLTLNLGVRYDYQRITPKTKNAFAPRFGVAYDPTGSGKTVIRGGFGQFYEYLLIGVQTALLQSAVIAPAFVFDTGQDTSALRGVLPTNACLLPQGAGGMALISTPCRAMLTTLRNQVNTSGFINTEPTIDGDRRMGYLWSFSAGLKHELIPNLAISADYVANRGRNQTALMDINEPRLLPSGQRGRPGVSAFDPSATLIPATARGANFQRVLQYQTREDLNSDYNALEVSVEKRFADRWSGRFTYTLSRARDTGSSGGGTSISTKRVDDDLNPRLDYGPANFDNRHSVGFGGNVNVWRGLGVGTTFHYYSGYPINEIVGLDSNGDRDIYDRPVKGRDDTTAPIVSPVDSRGTAIRNGIDGESLLVMNLRFQYVQKLLESHSLGLFWEIYNATNRANFGNPTGSRLSSNFLVPVRANDPRTMQLGIRYTF
jgi:outer membrane receptor protein involved in Fe transport